MRYNGLFVNDRRPAMGRFGEANVQVGSRGADVELLQRLLGAVGLPVKIDGKFGPETKEAVQNFQTRSGLMPTGACDQNTWDELHGAVGPLTPGVTKTVAPVKAVANNPAPDVRDGYGPANPTPEEWAAMNKPKPSGTPVGTWLVIGGIGLAGVLALYLASKSSPALAGSNK
jgi:peptidoglycan hydrolase-like protein with peptidoglycan-binding domain